MENNKNPLRSPDFNLFLAAEALQGALEAIFEMLAEIPTDETEAQRCFASLAGLAWAGRRVARELNAFLLEASDRHRFPLNYGSLAPEDDDDEIREPRVRYCVNHR